MSQIFPEEGDVKRRQFSEELRQHLPSSDWCAEHNNTCNPNNFTTETGPVIVHEPEHSFEFDAQMSPEGFGDDADRLIKPTTIHYVVRRKNGRWLATSQ